MKVKKPESRKPTVRVAPPAGKRLWPYALGMLVALYAAFQVYGSILHGPFLFDDDYLPFRLPNFPDDLRAWVRGVRPLLMLSYWVNFRMSGTASTFSYHILNVLFHVVNGLLVFLIVRRLLEWAGTGEWRRTILAVFGGGLFLLHPVQTESVAYVASRSENLSIMFFLGAFAVFVLRRRPAIGWISSAAVMLLFLAALTTKEHTLVLPILLILTDYWWNPGFRLAGLRRNWRIYAPMAAGALVGWVIIRGLLAHGGAAGFGIKEFTWYQYFFTQCRALFVYLRLFLFPAGQTVDYDFPISRTVFQHGAIAGLAVLLAVTAAAWIYRRRFPLASYGWLAFLILMAPTSSFMPILDPIAERRLYLSMIGLILAAAGFLARLQIDDRRLGAALALVLVIFGALAWQRNQVWTDRIALWQDAVRKSPGKPRAHFQLAYAWYETGNCAEAVAEYGVVAKLQPLKYDLLVDWALAYDCMNQPDEAVAKLKQAAALEPTAHVHAMIGMVYGKRSRWTEALDALAAAEKIDPGYSMTYVYKGGVHMGQNQFAEAVEDYRRALALDPNNQPAREALAAAEQQLRRAR